MSVFLGLYIILFHDGSRTSLISECMLPTCIRQGFSNPFFTPGEFSSQPWLQKTCAFGIILSERNQTYNTTYCIIQLIMKLMNRQTLTDASKSQNSDFLVGVWRRRGGQGHKGTLLEWWKCSIAWSAWWLHGSVHVKVHVCALHALHQMYGAPQTHLLFTWALVSGAWFIPLQEMSSQRPCIPLD